MTKKDCKEFSEFLHDDSGDDSLQSRTNCMSRKILVPEENSGSQVTFDLKLMSERSEIMFYLLILYYISTFYIFPYLLLYRF